jgi:hypothetical protein
MIRSLASLILAGALLWAGAAAAAVGTPTAIMAVATGVTSGTSAPTNVDAPVGSLIVVSAALWNTPDGTVTGCTLSSGDTLTQAAQPAPASGAFNQSLWYVSNSAHDLPSGGSVTCTTSNGSAYALGAWKVSGANGGLDASVSSNSGNASSITIATGTLAYANEIVFGSERYTEGTYTEGAGFTTLTNAANSVTAAYEIVSSTGSVTWAPSWSSGSNASGTVASFKATGASAANPHMLMLLGAGLAANDNETPAAFARRASY